MNLNTESTILNTIIQELAEMFFQFTVYPDKSMSFEYRSDALIDFLELDKASGVFIESRMKSDDLIRWNETLNRSIEMAFPLQFEVEVILPAKGSKWIKINANPKKLEKGCLVYYGKILDTTEQKSIHEDFQVNHERFHFAAMASNVGVWDWNLVTGEVYYSPESLEILEIEHDDSLISNPEEWDVRVHPDDLELYFRNINQHFEGLVPYYETYHRILCNGRYKWILDRGKVILRDEKGKPLRVVGTHTDVSAQKDREEKLQETLELVNNQKNKLLNFAHIVSHNLRNHTGNLCSLIEMNEGGMMSAEDTCGYVKKVSIELKNTIDNLIELVEIQSSNKIDKVSLNVNEYLTKIFNLLNDDLIAKKVEIINHVSSDFTVNIIPAYLESILLNLTTNAIKYSSPERMSVIEFYVEYTDDYKVLCVKDNGIGVDLIKHKDSIFGLYKTFHSNDDANGIGLHITKNQIESMGGKIEIESEINKGSVFKIYFS